MKLYDIQLSIQALDEFEPGTPEETAALAQAVANINGELEEKIDSIVATIKSIDADADALKNEIDRLQARRKSAEKRGESIRLFLRDFMKSVNKGKIKTTLFTVSRRSTPPKLEIISENQLPLSCFETKQILVNALVKAAVEAGTIPPEVARLTTCETINIR